MYFESNHAVYSENCFDWNCVFSNFADLSIKLRSLPIDKNSKVACLVYTRKFIGVDEMQTTR